MFGILFIYFYFWANGLDQGHGYPGRCGPMVQGPPNEKGLRWRRDTWLYHTGNGWPTSVTAFNHASIRHLIHLSLADFIPFFMSGYHIIEILLTKAATPIGLGPKSSIRSGGIPQKNEKIKNNEVRPNSPQNPDYKLHTLVSLLGRIHPKAHIIKWTRV